MNTATNRHHKNILWLALAFALGTSGAAHALDPPSVVNNSQQATDSDATSSDTKTVAKPPKSTTLSSINVSARALAGGRMAEQDQPKQVSTITAQAIAEVPITADYTQMINSVPGVNSASSDGFGLTDASSYTIRGFNASEIGVTLDGVPVNDAGNYAPYASEYGEARNYESITVSPGSADLDMPDLGAVGGHISFVTKAPTSDFNVFFGQTFGSDDARSTFVRLNTGDIGPVSSWISVSQDSDDKWRGAGQDQIHRIQAKSVWKIDDNNSITFNLNYNHERNYDYLYPTKAQFAEDHNVDYLTTWAPTPAGGFSSDEAFGGTAASAAQENYYKLFQNPWISYVASLDGEFKITPDLSLSVIPYFQYGGGTGTYSGFLPLSSTGTSPVQANQYSAGPYYSVLEAFRGYTYRPGINAKFTLNLGLDNTLAWGFWYERSRQTEDYPAMYVDPNTGTPASIWGDKNLLTYSNGLPWINNGESDLTTVKKVFVEDSWNPTEQWTFNAGVAYLDTQRQNQFVMYPNNPDPADWTYNVNSDERYHRFLPTLGASWRPDENNQIYYSLTRTFRAPQDSSTFGNSLLGLPPPMPESAWSNEIGWRFTDGPLTLNTNAYLSNMGNRTASGTDYNTYVSYYINAGPVRMAGVNAEGNLDLGHGLSLYSSYTYTQSKVKDDLNLPAGTDLSGGSVEAASYATAGKQFPGTPRNMVYLGTRWADRGLVLNLNGKFTGSEYGDFMNTDRVPSYFTLNGSASYELPDYGVLHKTTIALNALNLLNRHYLSLPYGPTIDAAESSPTYYVGAPRQWYLTISTTLF